jgi:hypothetical protein
MRDFAPSTLAAVPSTFPVTEENYDFGTQIRYKNNSAAFVRGKTQTFNSQGRPIDSDV